MDSPPEQDGNGGNSPSDKDKRVRPTNQIERAAILAGPLRPWMRYLAEWHATQTGKVTYAEVQAMAVQLAGCPISAQNVRLLLDRDDWMQYREEVAMDALLLHRKRFERRTGEYVDAHYWALEHAKLTQDHRAVQQITEPVIDRLWPKREDKGPAAQTIILNFNPQTPAAQVVDYEPLPVEIVPVEKEEPAP